MRYFLLLSFCLFSCAAQIKVKTPTVGLISPEALGGLGKFELGAGLSGTPALELTSNGALSSPDVSTPRVIHDSRFFVQGGLGILRRLDIYFDPGAWANAKLQLIGKPFTEAKKGNFSASLIGGFAWKNEDGRGSDLDFSKDKGISVSPNIRYTLKATQWKGGFLLGYRALDPVLFYLGGHRYEHRYSGGYDNVSGRDGRYAGRAHATSANLGLELSFGKGFVARLEDAYTVTKIPSAGARSSEHSFGFYLGGILPSKDN
jgi:hypothetical protein